MNEKIKKPVAIAVVALIVIVIIGLSAALICVCTLNTNGDKVFDLNAYEVQSATVVSVSANGEEKSAELTVEQTAALVNVLSASDMTLTMRTDSSSSAYRITLTALNGKTVEIKANGKYLTFEGKTYRTTGSVCNFLGHLTYGTL